MASPPTERPFFVSPTTDQGLGTSFKGGLAQTTKQGSLKMKVFDTETKQLNPTKTEPAYSSYPVTDNGKDHNSLIVARESLETESLVWRNQPTHEALFSEEPAPIEKHSSFIEDHLGAGENSLRV